MRRFTLLAQLPQRLARRSLFRPAKRRDGRPPPLRRDGERGQALLLMAVGFIGLAAFIGLLIDGGILFVAQAHLRRAVDAASLAAATQIREGQPFENIQAFATEFINLNGVNPSTVEVYDCFHLPDPSDPDYATLQYNLCDVAKGGRHPYPRKLIRVSASVDVGFTFLTLIGLHRTTITADATSEAASIDLVIVIDTSESMNSDNDDPGNPYYDPAVCNAWRNPSNPPNVRDANSPDGKCHPLWEAKQAAKELVATMTTNFDQVAIVAFDYRPRLYQELRIVTDADDNDGADDGDVYAALDNIVLHDDTPPPGGLTPGQYNPLDIACNITAPGNCPGTPDEDNAVLSTCTGCGIRVAGTLLKQTGRPQALWVIVFLSDGATNMSDVANDDYPDLDASLRSGINAASYPNGYCGGNLGGLTSNPLWGLPFCVNGGSGGTSSRPDFSVRHCGPYHDGLLSQCPPGTTLETDTPLYDVLDYARDQTDIAALTVNCRGNPTNDCDWPTRPTNRYNRNEPLRGANVAIYSIGLGLAAQPPDFTGERMLRYMAAVGDDGDRVTDPCKNPDGTDRAPQISCGNYYYSPTGAGLIAIFEDIARQIFTRLTG
jgi:Flp pilus assembly protein TadG